MYQNKEGFLVKEQGDLECESPDIVKDFWGFILGQPLFDDTLPKAKKVNLLK